MERNFHVPFDIRKESEDDFPLPVFEPDSIFIGREHQIDLFEMYYTRWKKSLFDTTLEGLLVTSVPSPDNKIQSLVVLLYGRGGFGKSTLLRRYRNIVLQDNENSLIIGKTVVSKIIDWESAIRSKRSIFNPPEGQEIDAHEYFRTICHELAESLGKKMQDFKEYQSVLKSLGRMRKKTSEVLETMQKQDDYNWLRGLAVEFITSAIRSHVPGSAEIMISSRQYQQALDYYNYACEIEKSLVDKTYIERGLVLSYLKRYSEAIELYKQELNKNRMNFIVLYNIAVAMVRWKGIIACQDHINIARVKILKAANSNNNEAIFYGLGGLEALESKVEEALNHLQQAIVQSESVLRWARHDMAWLYLRENPRFQSLVI